MSNRVTIKRTGKGYVISVGGVPKDTATNKADAKETAKQWRFKPAPPRHKSR